MSGVTGDIPSPRHGSRHRGFRSWIRVCKILQRRNFFIDTVRPAPRYSRLMSKTLLYTLATIGDLIFAYFAWQSGRVVLPIILLFAAFCFAAAAIGSALGKGGPR